MAGSGGPWGGGGSNGGDDGERPGGERPGASVRAAGAADGVRARRPQIPDIDEIVRKGTEQLRVLMGGRGGRGGGGGRPRRPALRRRGTLGLGALALVGLWAFQSFYTVKPEEQSVELYLRRSARGDCIGKPGLNFAPWPIVTARRSSRSRRERTEDIGSGTARRATRG